MRESRSGILLGLAGAIVVAGALVWQTHHRLGSLRQHTVQMEADSRSRIQRLAASMREFEAAQLQRQSEAVAADDRALSDILWLGSVFMLLLLLAGLVLMRREIRRRALAEAELVRAAAGLKEGMLRLERHTAETNQLSSFVEAIQACQNTGEFVRVAVPLVQSIFGSLSGCVALLNREKTLLTEVACFGNCKLMPAPFQPQDCWAIRRGQPYLVSSERQLPVCAHLGGQASEGSFCLPLIAQAELMGLFFLVTESKDGLDESQQKLAIVVAEQMSLALANLLLRERLRDLSILDPLTGLFNRRHMEENFEPIKVNCHVHQDRLAVVMVDIDHFKVFNDTHGHDAGDHVLKEVSQILQHHMRPQDLLCRYGGEELVMLLPELTLELAVARAEQCRRSVEAFKLSYLGRDIGYLTVSLGVSVYPEDGNDLEHLIKCADQALYHAKSGGRNQVVSSGNFGAASAGAA